MFKRIFLLILVLFIAISCRQNTNPLLSTPPTEDTEDNEITDGDNTDNDSTDNGSGYGYYDVYILGNDYPIKLSISDTHTMIDEYFNMILNSDGSPKFKLSKHNSVSTLPEGIEPIVLDSYVFDKDLNLIKEGSENTTGKISKKFRGVCIVRIYPDAEEKSDNSSLLGYYTIAGVYTEMEKNNTGSISRAMIKSEVFQNYGYDELIILRNDVEIKDTTSEASDTSSGNTANYRADILFNDDEGINFYYYSPDRTFKNQNTDYIFKRIAETTTE